MDQTIPHPELYRLPYTIDQFNGMPYRYIGQSGLRASVIGLGLWKIGFPETGDGSRVDPQTAMQLFDRAVELGVTFWDTANRYNDGSGNSERLIGRWFQSHPEQRRNIVLATKIFGGMDGRTPNHCRLSRINILESVYACLDRLQTDAIDLLYFHKYENYTPLEESLAAVEDLVRQDVVRYFGLGGLPVSRLREYQLLESRFSIRVRVVAVENGFNIVDGETVPEQAGVLDHCRQTGVSYIAYSPLAGGLLTDRYLEPEKSGPGDRLFDEGTLVETIKSGKLGRVRALAKLAQQWKLSLSQLTLAYMLTIPGMGPVIPGVSSLGQLESNAAAAKVTLTLEQQQRIQSVLHPA
jgi:aryl-alcohol dehydrogenase-like predicted oxidoreductase